MTKSRFIDEEIEVCFERKPGLPSSFTWRGQEYKIEAILEMQRKLDFQQAWWRRRHRDYYVVRTHAGQIFELYKTESLHSPWAKIQKQALNMTLKALNGEDRLIFFALPLMML